MTHTRCLGGGTSNNAFHKKGLDAVRVQNLPWDIFWNLPEYEMKVGYNLGTYTRVFKILNLNNATALQLAYIPGLYGLTIKLCLTGSASEYTDLTMARDKNTKNSGIEIQIQSGIIDPELGQLRGTPKP